MIPKIIHYCWFGENEMPVEVIKVIAQWKEKLQGYEFMLWNEDNFDYNQWKFADEAYKSRKYAFVADVCRLNALYNLGGVYLDTDVEIIKSFDDLLYLKAFIGFEDDFKIGTSVIGSEKKGVFIKEFLDIYKERAFILPNNKLNMVSNVDLITNYLKQKEVISSNKMYDYEDRLTVFPKDYFSPKVFDTGEIYKTENTYSIHHFSQSWFSFRKKSIQYLKKISFFLIGYKNTRNLIKRINNE